MTDELKQFNLRMPVQEWVRFVRTVPREQSINARIVELILSETKKKTIGVMDDGKNKKGRNS